MNSSQVLYSILIPTFNQSRKLSLCLQNLADLNFDKARYEVLIIDNGSTDHTKEVAEGFIQRNNHFQYHYCAERGLMAARHMGADRSSGEILCFIDDDSMVDPAWLSSIEQAFQSGEVVVAEGPVVPHYESEPPGWADYFWVDTPYGKCNYYLSLIDFGNEKKFVSPQFVFGCNYIIRKAAFYKFGGTLPDYFPQEYKQYQGSGETGLSIKLENAGIAALYHPGIKIRHVIPPSRLTHEYFSFKQYFIGITASYQDYRKQSGLDGYPKPDLPPWIRILSPVRRSAGKVKRKILSLLNNLRPTRGGKPEPEDITALRALFLSRFQEGYTFHRSRVKKDPALLKWVLHIDYLGDKGKLPA